MEIKSLIQYLLIAFLLPLICLLGQKITGGVAGGVDGGAAVTVQVLNFILYGIEAASPSIAAIAVICLINREKLSDYFGLRLNIKAIALPLITAWSTMCMARLFWNACTGMKPVLGAISSKQFIIIAWALIAEEFGWRGFLEPKICEMLGIGDSAGEGLASADRIAENTTVSDNGMSASADKKTVPGDFLLKRWIAVLITGLIWSAWHYHFFILNGMEVPIYLFVIGAVVESVIYSFFMQITDSNLVTAMVYHFSWNLFLHLFMINPSDNAGNLGIYELMVIIEIVIATVCVMLEFRRYKIGK